MPCARRPPPRVGWLGRSSRSAGREARDTRRAPRSGGGWGCSSAPACSSVEPGSWARPPRHRWLLPGPRRRAGPSPLAQGATGEPSRGRCRGSRRRPRMRSPRGGPRAPRSTAPRDPGRSRGSRDVPGARRPRSRRVARERSQRAPPANPLAAGGLVLRGLALAADRRWRPRVATAPLRRAAAAARERAAGGCPLGDRPGAVHRAARRRDARGRRAAGRAAGAGFRHGPPAKRRVACPARGRRRRSRWPDSRRSSAWGGWRCREPGAGRPGRAARVRRRVGAGRASGRRPRRGGWPGTWTSTARCSCPSSREPGWAPSLSRQSRRSRRDVWRPSSRRAWSRRASSPRTPMPSAPRDDVAPGSSAALPDALDLLAVGAAAGRAPAPLFGEIAGGTRGRPRHRARDHSSPRSRRRSPVAGALERLRDRTGAPELGALAAALERSRRYGSPLADQLHAQAATLRREERRRVEERAARAAPKIQLVVALVLVPSALLTIAAALIAHSDSLFGGVVTTRFASSAGAWRPPRRPRRSVELVRGLQVALDVDDEGAGR